MTDMNLAGKDYFTREEAAHYACWSERHWDKMRITYGLEPFDWGGKKVYRKADIQRAMEGEACRQFDSGASRGISGGRGQNETRPARRKSTSNPLGQSPRP